MMRIGKLLPYLVLTSLLCSGLLLGAQSTGQAFLWKLEADHFEQPSYLLAVLPSSDPVNYPASETIYPYIKNCSAYATVWPCDAIGKNRIIGAMQIEDVKALRKALGKSGYNAVESLVRERLETDLIYYQTWQPLYLRRVLLDRGLKQGTQQLSTEYVYQLSKSANLPTQTLIDHSKLGKLSRQVDYTTQSAMLLDYATQPEQFEQLLEALTADYQEGDFDAVRRVFDIVEPNIYVGYMIDQLNESIAVRISELAMSGSTFFAVEAKHFGGDYNLLLRLTELGITVTPATGTPPIVPEADPPSEEETVATETLAEGGNEPVDSIPEAPVKMVKQVPDFIGISDDAAGEPSIDGFNYFNYPVDSSILPYWVSVTADLKDFIAYMPAIPRYNATAFEGEEGRVEMQYYALNDTSSGLYYIISRNTYPPDFEIKNLDRFFDRNVRSVQKQFGGEVTASADSRSFMISKRSFVVNTANGEILRSNLLLFDNRMYQVAVMGPANMIYENGPNTFMGAFKLLSSGQDWSYVNGKDFTARMPLQPVVRNGRVNTPDGDILVEHYNVNIPGNGLLYSLYVNRYPDKFRSGGLTGFYDRLSQETLTNLRAYADKEEKVKLDGLKGRYVEASSASKRFRIYFFLDGKNLYQLMVSGTPQQLKAADLNYFVNSFQLN